MRHEITVQKVLGERPQGIPVECLIFNAPRPLRGNIYEWEGEFVTGRHYAAVDPSGDTAQWCIQENANLAAVLCEYVSLQEIDDWARKELGEYYESSDAQWHRPMYMGKFGSRNVPIESILPGRA